MTGPPSLRQRVIERDRGLCRYCGCTCSDRWPTDHLTLDHVMPRSRGGTNQYNNLVVACRACNHRKGDRTLSEAGMDLLPLGTLVLFPRHRKEEARSAVYAGAHDATRAGVGQFLRSVLPVGDTDEKEHRDA